MSSIVSTTRGSSVMRSSRPSKSPKVTDSPSHVELPRLWYIVTSFSASGTIRGWPSLRTGVYGNEVAGSIAGKSGDCAAAVTSTGFPSASRYGEVAWST